jgi:hypothetical protein
MQAIADGVALHADTRRSRRCAFDVRDDGTRDMKTS